MSVDWGTWTAFTDASGMPLHEADRATAEGYFKALMAAREDRTRALEELLRRNDVTIALDEAGLHRLEEWYREHVELSAHEAERLSDRWYAVGLDIALYLGEAVIARAPNVGWRMSTFNARDLSYQRPVLMGFRAVKNRRYNVDPELLVATHGLRIASGLEAEELFTPMVQLAVARA